MLELSVPVNLTPVFQFFKTLGEHQRKRLIRRSKELPEMKNTIDCFYVLYVFSTGIIDDVTSLTKFIVETEWHKLPL